MILLICGFMLILPKPLLLITDNKKLKDACEIQNLCFHIVIESKTMRKYFSIIISIVVFSQLHAQQVEKSVYGTFALTNATVETVTKGKLENATVIIHNGMISAVGPDVKIP